MAQKAERDLALDPHQSTKDIMESTFYQDPLYNASLKDDSSIPPASEEVLKKISPHIKHRKAKRTLLIEKMDSLYL
jgi:hypothetical protein